MKTTFAYAQKPLLCAMVSGETVEAMQWQIVNSLYDGADAFGIQLCTLKQEERSEEKLRNLFASCKGRPIYITSYRYNHNEGFTDDECVELLLKALDCGATILDVVGDFFGPAPLELATEPAAIAKQRALIDRIHEKGGEVLMSSHIHCYQSAEKLLEIAREQEARGADVIKIVTFTQTQEELDTAFEALRLFRENLKKPFLLLGGGAYSGLLRQLGIYFGCCTALCVQQHAPGNTIEQPKLSNMRTVRDHMLV